MSANDVLCLSSIHSADQLAFLIPNTQILLALLPSLPKCQTPPTYTCITQGPPPTSHLPSHFASTLQGAEVVLRSSGIKEGRSWKIVPVAGSWNRERS